MYRVLLPKITGRPFPIQLRKSLPLWADRRSEVRRCFWRARRFNRFDPFFANIQDPLSLHKYLYVHGDPVQAIDPSGLFSLGATTMSVVIALTLVSSLGAMFVLHEAADREMKDHGTIRVHLDAVIIQPVNVMPGGYYPWSNSDVSSRMDELAAFWNKYGVDVTYSIRSVVNEDWKSLDIAPYVGAMGLGEIQEVVAELYDSRPLLVFVPNIADEHYAGITAWDERGAAVGLGLHWAGVAHELGHVFGLGHGLASHLSWTSNNLMRNGGPERANVKKVWLYDYQVLFARTRLLSTGWGQPEAGATP